MSRRKSWEFRSFAACLLLTAACGSNTESETDDQSQTPQTTTPGSNASTPTAGKTGGSAGAKATAGSGTTSSAGTSGSAGAGSTVTAMAIIEPFMMAGAATGAAGAGAAGSGTSGAAAGASGSSSSTGAAGKSGSGTSGAGGASTSSGGASGSGGKAAGGAGGTGSGAGLVGVTGTATFTKSRIGVDLSIDISAGCVSGKSYAVHIHEGTSCDSVATQMGHWGAAPMPLPLENAAGSGAAGSAAGAAGSGSAGHSSAAAGAGAAGHDASHAAAGSGAAGSAAGAAGAAGSGTTLVLRGEDIPPITCSGVSGKSSTTRSTPDKRLIWTIGTGDETDVVGHVLVVHDTDGSRIGCGKIQMK